jgi:Tfp pilus assembly protein PilX
LVKKGSALSKEINMKKLTSFLKALRNKDEKGAVLVIGLLLILVLTILSMAAMMTTAMELKIARNDRSAKRVFYAAEAGAEDARSRLQTVGSSSPIPDNQPTNANWTAFIGTPTEAALQGYVANSDQILYSPLSYSSLDYVVTIKHKLNSPIE